MLMMIVKFLAIMRCSDFGEGTWITHSLMRDTAAFFKSTGVIKGYVLYIAIYLHVMQVMGQCWIRCLVA